MITLPACGANNNDGAVDETGYDYNQVTYGPGNQENGRLPDINRFDNNFPNPGRGPIIPEDRNNWGQQQAQPDQQRDQQRDQPRDQQDQQNQQNQQRQDTGDGGTDEATGEVQEQVVQLTNEAREEQGLQPLKLSKEVSEVAQDKSEDMAENEYFSHTSPTYGTPFDMLKEYNVDYRTAAENIAKGQKTPESVVDGWLNSSGHRKNIMNENMTEIGIGYSESGNYWTQMFIGS